VAEFVVKPSVRWLPVFAVVVSVAGLGVHSAGSSSRPVLVAASSTAAGSATVDEALRAAARTGRPVGVSSYTTETDTLTAEPDGKLALVQQLEPVRKKVDGAWKALDPTLVQNADGSWSPAVTVGGLRLSGGGNGPLVTMYADGTSLTLSLPVTVLPAPEIRGATATYEGILPGIDLAVTGDQFGSFSEVFVVQDALAAADPALLRMLRWSTATVGLTLSADAAGNIEARNASGTVLITAPAPTMWDSHADDSRPTTTDQSGATVDAETGDPARSSEHAAGVGARVAPVQVALDATGITLVPDASLLTAPDTTFPLYIDPGFTAAKKSASSSSTAWTTVASNYATTSYWKASELKVGYQGWLSPHFKARSFIVLSVPASTLAGAAIYSSQLQLDETWSGSCTKSTVNLYRTGTISSSTTWNNQPDRYELIDNPSAAKGYDSGCPSGNVGFDMLSEIKSMVGGKHTAVTVGLYASESDKNSWKKFSPKVDTSGDYGSLTTLYNHPPGTPTASMAATSPKTSCTSTITVGDAAVTLQVTPSDSDRQSVGVGFRLTNPSGATVWSSDDGQTSNSYAGSAYSSTTGKYAQARVTVSEATLKNAAGSAPMTFSWQAQVWDGLAETAWGPSTPCRFTFDPTHPGAPTVTADPGDTVTVGQAAHFAVTGSGASYQVQLNGRTQPPVKADAAGNAVVSVVPTRVQNVVTVTAVSVGGNIGTEPGTVLFDAGAPAVAADGDLSTDGVADMTVVGTATGIPKTGLYAAVGTGTTGGFATATKNVGTAGTGLSPSGSSADFAGGQTLIGHFDGGELQDVLAYFPADVARSDGSITFAGTGVVLPGEADGTLMAQDPDSVRSFTAESVINPDIGMSHPPIWLAGAANLTGHALPPDGSGVTVPDLFGIAVSDAGPGVLEVIPSIDGGAGAGVYDTGKPLYAAVNSTTRLAPPGGGDWSTWRLASALTSAGPVLYLWRPGTAGLWRWSDLSYTDVDDTAVLTVGASTQLSATLTIPATSTIQAVDVNADTTPDLRVVTNTGTATAYLVNPATAALTAQSSQALTW
jgi:hypothetical protein